MIVEIWVGTIGVSLWLTMMRIVLLACWPKAEPHQTLDCPETPRGCPGCIKEADQ